MKALNPYTTREFDEAAVQAAVRGGRPYLAPADRHEVIRRLTAREMTAGEIAVQLGCCRRTVVRARNGEAGRS